MAIVADSQYSKQLDELSAKNAPRIAQIFQKLGPAAEEYCRRLGMGKDYPETHRRRYPEFYKQQQFSK